MAGEDVPFKKCKLVCVNWDDTVGSAAGWSQAGKAEERQFAF